MIAQNKAPRRTRIWSWCAGAPSALLLLRGCCPARPWPGCLPSVNCGRKPAAQHPPTIIQDCVRLGHHAFLDVTADRRGSQTKALGDGGSRQVRSRHDVSLRVSAHTMRALTAVAPAPSPQIAHVAHVRCVGDRISVHARSAAPETTKTHTSALAVVIRRVMRLPLRDEVR